MCGNIACLYMASKCHLDCIVQVFDSTGEQKERKHLGNRGRVLKTDFLNDDWYHNLSTNFSALKF